jgi:hypothetical protein
MIEGLYKVTYKTPLGEGTGVVTVLGGRIRGGTHSTYYTGTYTLGEDGRFEAQIDIDIHTVVPGLTWVLGVPRARLSLTGRFTGQSAKMTGTSPDAPGIGMQARLTRLAD